jgi:hypothetical protein
LPAQAALGRLTWQAGLRSTSRAPRLKIKDAGRGIHRLDRRLNRAFARADVEGLGVDFGSEKRSMRRWADKPA